MGTGFTLSKEALPSWHDDFSTDAAEVDIEEYILPRYNTTYIPKGSSYYTFSNNKTGEDYASVASSRFKYLSNFAPNSFLIKGGAPFMDAPSKDYNRLTLSSASLEQGVNYNGSSYRLYQIKRDKSNKQFIIFTMDVSISEYLEKISKSEFDFSKPPSYDELSNLGFIPYMQPTYISFSDSKTLPYILYVELQAAGGGGGGSSTWYGSCGGGGGAFAAFLLDFTFSAEDSSFEILLTSGGRGGSAKSKGGNGYFSSIIWREKTSADTKLAEGFGIEGGYGAKGSPKDGGIPYEGYGAGGSHYILIKRNNEGTYETPAETWRPSYIQLLKGVGGAAGGNGAHWTASADAGGNVEETWVHVYGEHQSTSGPSVKHEKKNGGNKGDAGAGGGGASCLSAGLAGNVNPSFSSYNDDTSSGPYGAGGGGVKSLLSDGTTGGNAGCACCCIYYP